MTTKRTKRTAASLIDGFLTSKKGIIPDVVRRQLSSLPRHISISEVVTEVTGRGYKLLVSPQQMVIITDRSLTIFD